MSAKKLIGKRLIGVDLADDKKAIRFHVEGSAPVVAWCDAECCSETWIESVEMPALGLPATVTAVGDLDMPDLGDLPGRDCMAYYGFKISTDRGEIVIDYRNESNGYYGGTLEWSLATRYEGVFKQAELTGKWRPIAA